MKKKGLDMQEKIAIKEMKIIKKKDMFCYETALSTICNYYNIPYQLLFSNTWIYDYNEYDCNVGNNIIITDWHLFDKLRELGIVEEEVEEIKNTRYLRTKLEQGNVAIIRIDIQKFNKMRGTSYTGLSAPYLVYGYEKGFIAYDLHYTHEVIIISDEIFKYACKNIKIYRMRDNAPQFVFKYSVDCIRKYLVPANPNFQKMRYLAKLFEKGVVDLKNETKGLREEDTPASAPLIDKIATLARGRNMFSLYLSYINSMIPEIDITDACEKMAYWAGKWNLVKVILIKAYYKKDYSQDVMKKIATIISDIASGEKKLYEQLVNVELNVFKKKNSRYLENIDGKNQKMQAITIELSKLYNNAGIVIAGSDKEADMTGLGAYIEYEKEQLLMTKLEFQDKYNLIEIAQNVLDNISCQEQEIEIPRSIYNRLNILGCSDYGNFSDYITICYEDEMEKVLIQLSSWINKQPQFNDKIYCTGKLLETTVRLHQSSGTLFTQSLNLKNKRVVSIKLPNCPAMHIFSIYFE